MEFNDPEYLGQRVQIGRGFLGLVPVTQSGFLVIEAGVLTLLTSDEAVIASAPLSECFLASNIVTTLTMGQTTLVKVAGTAYSVTVGHHMSGAALPAAAVHDQRKGTKAFKAAFTSLSEGRSIR